MHSFSICTIVNNADEYSLMKKSFQKNGFTENCEYIVADNIHSNQKDAYQAIPWFLSQANSDYVLIVHQDVRCIDNREKLEKILTNLTKIDPAWAVCGNAGCDGYKSCYHYLIDPANKKLSKKLPKKVFSLDENFLLISQKNKPFLSDYLSGFHLYGTDICINALSAGNTCYVIPFLVEHLSSGNLEKLNEYLPDFLMQYKPRIKRKFIQTTCTKFYISHSFGKTTLLYSGLKFELIKAWERIKGVFK